MFVRVKDKDTGHEYDVPENDRRIGGGVLSAVKPGQYPLALRPRPAKHHVKLAGRPASREKASSTEAPAEARTHKEK